MSEDITNGLKGAFWGALFGGTAGLGVCVWLITTPPFFTGDTILIGAVACGVLGFIFGDRFLDWLKDVWFRF